MSNFKGYYFLKPARIVNSKTGTMVVTIPKKVVNDMQLTSGDLLSVRIILKLKSDQLTEDNMFDYEEIEPILFIDDVDAAKPKREVPEIKDITEDISKEEYKDDTTKL